jgi:carbon monoxide dehydrogenase subunit G
VTDTKLEAGARVVTFANGLVAREPIVSIDDQLRRLVWGASGGRTTHYNAALEVLAEGTGSRVIWTIDLLPDEMAGPIGAMQEQGLAALARAMDRGA